MSYKRKDQHFNDYLPALSDLKPKRKITDAQVCEIFFRQSQCIKTREGKCPMLLFSKQLAEELNEFFWSED